MSWTRRDLLKTAGAGAATAVASVSAYAADIRSVRKWDKEADVVIVGLGGAGMTTAIVAADEGCSVLVVERQPKATHRSNTRMSGGVLHTPSKTGDRAALKAYALAMFSGENVPGKIEGEQPETSEGLAEAWAEYCPYVIDFLKKQDPEFQGVVPPTHQGRNLAGTAFPNFPGADKAGYAEVRSSYPDRIDFGRPQYNRPKKEASNGEALFDCLMEGLNKRTGKIRIDYETRASQLVQNEKRQVVGVIATDKSGKQVAYKARKGVVLCSGGYEYNVAMRKAFLEGPGCEGWAFYGSPFNEGDGIAMGLQVGAALQKVSSAASRLVYPSPVRHNGLRMAIFANVVGAGHTVLVNQFGKRFIAEHKVSSDPQRYFFYKEAVKFDIDRLVYPNTASWMIFDEELRASRPVVVVDSSTTGYGFVPWGKKDNSDAVAKGWILKADTIEELGRKILAQKDNCGLMDPKELVKTIDHFNDLCATGTDTDYGRTKAGMVPLKKGPFYAIPLVAGGPNTKGGLAANAKREVLDWTLKPIVGLYAVGEIASAFKFVYQGGGNLTECIVFGQVCGKEIARQPNHI